ncbi:MAG: Dabb family protein [Verrucomicrobiota bacterium]
MKSVFLFLSLLISVSAAPLTHSVYFKLKHEKSSAEAVEFYKEAMQLATIPGVENFAWLEEFSPKNDFAYGLTMQFKDQKAYDYYNDHPLHVRFVNEVWIPNVVDFMEIDTVPGTLLPEKGSTKAESSK